MRVRWTDLVPGDSLAFGEQVYTIVVAEHDSRGTQWRHVLCHWDSQLFWQMADSPIPDDVEVFKVTEGM